MPNYRVLVTYDPDRSVFHARAPELEHCSAEGATRTEALVKLEEEIEAQLRNVREQGGRPPSAVDEDAELSGAITVTVSRTLHRDLVWQARNEGVELGALVGEMLAAGLEARRQRGRRAPMNSMSTQPESRAPSAANDAEQPPLRNDPRGDRRGYGREGGGRGQGGRYHAIMEDRATFLEYVRGLESGGGRGPGGPGGGPRRPRGPSRPGGGRGGAGGSGGPDEGGT